MQKNILICTICISLHTLIDLLVGSFPLGRCGFVRSLGVGSIFLPLSYPHPNSSTSRPSLISYLITSFISSPPTQVRLLQKDGNQLEKRSTAAVGPVVSSTPLPLSSALPLPLPGVPAPMSTSKNKSREKGNDREKEWSGDSTKDREADAMGRSPCWLGLDNGKSMRVVAVDASLCVRAQ